MHEDGASIRSRRPSPSYRSTANIGRPSDDGTSYNLGNGRPLRPAQHLDYHCFLGAVARILPGSTRLARPTRLARLAQLAPAFGAFNGGAQDAQDLVGPGFARPVAFGLQPMLGGLAGGEQLLLRAELRLGRGQVGRYGGRRGHRRVFGRLDDVGGAVIVRGALGSPSAGLRSA